MLRGRSWSLFGCAQQQDERQRAQTKAQEVLAEYEGHFFTARLTEHWDRLPREVVGFPSLEIFRTHLDAILHNVL